MTQTIADERRRWASQLAYRTRLGPNFTQDDALSRLAPHLTPAERTERLAELHDALTLRDGVDKIADLDDHLVPDQLSLIDPKLVPDSARPAYSELLAAARRRKDILVRDLDRLEGLSDELDAAIKRWRDVHTGYLPASEVEPEYAHPDMLAEMAEDELVAALAQPSFRATQRMQTAISELQIAAWAHVDRAFTALIGDPR
jgi:hypothetical protein